MVPCVYMLCGLPFAGKTTLAKQFVQYLGFPYVSIDEINNVRGLGNNNSWIAPTDWDLTYAEAFRQLDAHLRAGRSVIYDAANFTRAERDDVRAVAAQSGSDTCVIYVTTPEAIVRQRWQENRVTHVRNDIRDDFFEQVVTQFTPPTEDEHVLSYANEQDVEAWIERLIMLEQAERKSLYRQQLQEFRQLWDEAVQSGPGKFRDIEELIQEAESRFKAQKLHEDRD